MNDKKKKTFIEPEAEVVTFLNNDIITLSDNESEGFSNDGYREGWWN